MQVINLIKDIRSSKKYNVIDSQTISTNGNTYKKKHLRMAIYTVLYLIVGVLGKKVYDLNSEVIKQQLNQS